MVWLSDRRPDWARGPLLPVIVIDDRDGELLMQAWANEAALAATEATGEAHFWSRSRGELWRKGATSGNVMPVASLALDCDADAIVYRVRPAGPACHTGTRSCFDGADARLSVARLGRVIAGRRGADPGTSYTARLLADAPRRPAQKVIEEAGEAALAAAAGTRDELIGEAADLVYHLLVLLESAGVGLDDVERRLAERHAAPGGG